MKTTISILGCGWLGSSLGYKLLSNDYIVKGSTKSYDAHIRLEMSGIQPYFMTVTKDFLEVDYANFFNTDVLIIALPPARVEDIEDVFPQQIQQIINYITSLKIKKVIFISSTSVYENSNTIVREGDEGHTDKDSGRALLKAESLLRNIEGVQTTIIRFGGLIGGKRNPASFLRGKRDIAGNVPVNLIHTDDCVDIIIRIIEKEAWGETYNACSPSHPTKLEFYTLAAEISDVEVPQFINKAQDFKVVNSDKLIQGLGYTFIYDSPIDYLKSLEEWSYHI